MVCLYICRLAVYVIVVVVVSSSVVVDVASCFLLNTCFVVVVFASGYDAFQWACVIGALEFIKLFLDHGYNPNTPAQMAFPPLHLSVLVKNKALLQRLLRVENIEIDLRSTGGLTPLLHALDEGYDDIARLLIESGADVSAKETASTLKIPALALMAMREEHSLVSILLNSGADIAQTDIKGHNAFMFAAATGSIKMVDLLLKHPETNLNPEVVHALDNAGDNVISYAISGGPNGRRGPSGFRHAGRPGKEQRAPIVYDERHEREHQRRGGLEYALVSKLLMHDIDPNVHDSEKGSIIYRAAMRGLHRVCFLLLQHGVTLDHSSASSSSEQSKHKHKFFNYAMLAVEHRDVCKWVVPVFLTLLLLFLFVVVVVVVCCCFVVVS